MLRCEYTKIRLVSTQYHIVQYLTVLQSADACAHIGCGYKKGIGGLSVNKERTALFRRIGALRGDIYSRNNIGRIEYDLGNHEIGIRHWKIAAEAGCQRSLDALKDVYNNEKEPGKEFITKEDLGLAYRACHGAQMEVKSEEREKHSKM